jgi:hypothetical protein
MSKVDDELTRRLRRAERPVDTDDLFEGLERRRSHRERVRRVQAGLLAFAVLAATVGGFSVLTRLFDPDRRATLAVTPFGATGAIVICGDQSGGQICRIHADALARGASTEDMVRLTDFSDELVASPSVSPDGTTVVFERHAPGAESTSETSELWTIGTDGTDLRQITARGSGFTMPSWSPSGLLVAVADRDVPQPGHSATLAILDANRDASDGQVETIDLPGLRFVSWPQWSPDGRRILFAAGVDPPSTTRTDVYTIGSDGSNLTEVTESNLVEYTPRWSPDGKSIAYSAGTPDGVGVFICAIPCSHPRQLDDTEGKPINGTAPVWTPDGNWIAFQVEERGFTTDIHVARIDGSEERTLASSAGEMAWIPVVDDGSTPSPDLSSSQADVGFGFGVCEVSQVAGQFDGLGATDTAYVAIERDGGECPPVQSASAYVGIDLDADGLVDVAHGPIACEVYYCRAFAAPDLDGDDGRHELFVVESAGSIIGLGVYALGGEATSSDGDAQVVRIEIGEPDLPQTGFITGEPARIFIGGDEGWSYRLRCEDHGVNRFIYQQRAFRPVDSTGPATVDETTLIYSQGRLDIFDAREPEQSASDDPLGPQPEEVCGAAIPKI